MTKSVTKIQDKDSRKRLSVVRSKEDPTKYGVVILNPDGSKICGPQGPQGCPGPEGPSICSAGFNGDDIDFGRSDGCTVVLEDAKCCLKGDSGVGICCSTCNKVGKTTEIELQYTDGTCFEFCVQDGQDGQGSGDMLKCVYDPNGCEKNVFDYDNLDNKPDLSCYQEKLIVGNGVDITNNKISTTFIYGESSTAAATVQKEVSIPSITELNVGQVIIVKPTVTSTVASSTLKLNSFPAYKMLYNAAEITTSTDSVVWGANIPSMFYLDEVSGTKYWRFLGHGLDSNTTYTLNRLIDPSRYKVGTGTYAFSRYSLVMEKADGTWEKITNTAAAYSTGTTKTVNTNGFKLGHIRYYNTTTNLANGALVAANAIDIQAPSVTASYSFNCGTAPGWAVGTPIYLVGSIGADGLFYLDTTQWRATQLPGAKDGKLYIRLGTSLSADNSTFSLIAEKPIYYYDNGIKVYQQADNKQDVISDLDDIRNCACCAMPNSTKYGASLDLSMNSSTYVITAQLKDQDGCNLGSACCIDLPVESMVVDACYLCATKEIELILQSGSCVCFSVADLVSGLQTEIDSCHKICSDYVDTTGQTNQFVTATEKCCISTALQECDNISCLCNDSGYVKGCDIACINGCCLTNGGDICIEGGGKICPQIEYLIVGGGGGGSSATVWQGGGGGQVIQSRGFICCGEKYCVCIGEGGDACCAGCPTCICGTCLCITANGGCDNGYSGSGFPAGTRNSAAAGGGGSNGPGGDGFCACYNGSNFSVTGVGGAGCITDIAGCIRGYGGGGGKNASAGGGDGGDGSYGGGGGKASKGGFGIAYIRYAKNGNDGITAANGGYKYGCRGYCIHRFSFDEEFIVLNSDDCPKVDILLVGGGGGGGRAWGTTYSGGGGGGGGIIYRCGYFLTEKTYCVKIGSGGGCGFWCSSSCCCDPTSGGSSCFGNLIAYGGGRGGSLSAVPSSCGSGGGGAGTCCSVTNSCLGCRAKWTNSQGRAGGCGYGCRGGGGGGGQYAGGNASSTGAGCGGCGCGFDISGECCYYGGGGGGGGKNAANYPGGCGGCGGGGDGNGYGKISGDCDATYYGGGGGGGIMTLYCCSGCGCQGIFILRYPVSCGYDITGGDCCYECNGNCIHIFTSNGTLTVN